MQFEWPFTQSPKTFEENLRGFIVPFAHRAAEFLQNYIFTIWLALSTAFMAYLTKRLFTPKAPDPTQAEITKLSGTMDKLLTLQTALRGDVQTCTTTLQALNNDQYMYVGLDADRQRNTQQKLDSLSESVDDLSTSIDTLSENAAALQQSFQQQSTKKRNNFKRV